MPADKTDLTSGLARSRVHNAHSDRHGSIWPSPASHPATSGFSGLLSVCFGFRSPSSGLFDQMLVPGDPAHVSKSAADYLLGSVRVISRPVEQAQSALGPPPSLRFRPARSSRSTAQPGGLSTVLDAVTPSATIICRGHAWHRAQLVLRRPKLLGRWRRVRPRPLSGYSRARVWSSLAGLFVEASMRVIFHGCRHRPLPRPG